MEARGSGWARLQAWGIRSGDGGNWEGERGKLWAIGKGVV